MVNMSRMTSCPTCGGMIAETAGACPRCGIILKPQTSVVAVGLIIMLVIAILYVLLIRYS